MHFGESFIAAYYERVRGFATVANVRFPGPSGRNWSDLDVIALPMPPMLNGLRRPAEIVQVKWRARFRLHASDSEWLDDAVVNPPDVHAAIAARLGDWPYRVVLVTTKLWLNELGDRESLTRRLSASACAQSPTCEGVDVRTFEEIALEWRVRLGEAVQGWAEDPFSFQLQVLQAGQTAPPGRAALPPDPELSDTSRTLIVGYDHTREDCQAAATKWLELLTGQPRTYKLLAITPYVEGTWAGMAAQIHGGTWVFLGSAGPKRTIISVWSRDGKYKEQFTLDVAVPSDLQAAARRFYAWWSWGER